MLSQALATRHKSKYCGQQPHGRLYEFVENMEKNYIYT